MTLALVLFALAAVGGLVMATSLVRGATLPPFAIAILHGAAAAGGLLALIVWLAGGGESSTATVGLVLMVVAALGGFLLFASHLRKKALPLGLVVVHALVAVAGFLALLVGAVG